MTRERSRSPRVGFRNTCSYVYMFLQHVSAIDAHARRRRAPSRRAHVLESVFETRSISQRSPSAAAASRARDQCHRHVCTVSALWSAGAGVDNAFICYLLDSDSALGEPDNVLGERDTCLIACYRVNGQKSSHALARMCTCVMCSLSFIYCWRVAHPVR